MAELDDIFSNGDEKLSDEALLQYLAGNTSDEEKHAVEKKLNVSSFESEAVEGLEQFKHKESLNDYVQQLNKNLHQQLTQKKQRKEKRKIKEMPLAVITVVIILILCVLGYIAIALFQRSKQVNLMPAQTSTHIISAKE